MKNKFILLLSLLAPSVLLSMSKEEELYHAVVLGNKPVVENLLAQGINPCKRIEEGRTLLHVAARHLRPQLIPIFISAGIQINDCQNDSWATPLLEAVQPTWGRSNAEKIKTVQLLIENGADPRIHDLQNRTPLAIASLYGNLAVIPLLEEKLASYAEVSTEEEISIKQEEQTVLRRSTRLQIKTEKK